MVARRPQLLLVVNEQRSRKTKYQLNQSIAKIHVKIMASLSDAKITMADLSVNGTVASDKGVRDSGSCFRHSPPNHCVSHQMSMPKMGAWNTRRREKTSRSYFRLR
jgi:hypothetical protein